MKDIERLVDRGIEIVKECCGDVLGSVRRPIVINYRAKTRWGRCSLNCGRYTIEISARILKDEVPDNATLSTIVHELLHACHGGMTHKGMWRVYATQVNALYPELAISRTSSAERFGLEEEQRQITRQYGCECDKCGYTLYRTKQSRFIQHPEWYKHTGCGGHFKRIA